MVEKKLQGYVEKPVKVGILHMRWFFQNKMTFVTFSQQLQNVPNRFFSSKFMSCLLDQFWS